DTGAFAVSGAFTDNMVIQREKPVTIWGTAPRGEWVKVRFAGKCNTVEAVDGVWEVTLPEVVEYGGPYEMVITIPAASDSIKLGNILVGDVWMCSGQSNMEMSVEKCSTADEALKAAEDMHNVRFFINAAGAYGDASGIPLESPAGMWMQCNANTSRKLSAAAFIFAQYLHDNSAGNNGVPIGLVQSAWGGEARRDVG
ncbi:MAG: hypothetical protein GF344_09775, partial [Chitinivibrionales bacterium]|nr:hypothetical protein [Chitinivibrionales bacterium]MBD3357128.1 hypothetical protein [Chitinivibrionales bacterium]